MSTRDILRARNLALLEWFISKFPTYEQVFVPTFQNDGKGWKFTDYFEENLKDLMTAVETGTRTKIKEQLIVAVKNLGRDTEDEGDLLGCIEVAIEASIPESV